MTHGGVRWKSDSLPTRGWIWGTNWIAEAPVPITATLRPVRSRSWFQAAEWKTSPSKDSSPGSSGVLGTARMPAPHTSTSAVSGPAAVSSSQRERSSLQRASVTPWPRRIRGVMPKRSETSRM